MTPDDKIEMAVFRNPDSNVVFVRRMKPGPVPSSYKFGSVEYIYTRSTSTATKITHYYIKHKA